MPYFNITTTVQTLSQQLASFNCNLFWYLNKFNFELGYKKIMLTIYKMLTLQLFDFVDQKKNTLFSLENLTEQIIFFSMVVVWIFSFIVFIIMTKKYSIKRSISNSRIIYECPSISKVNYYNLEKINLF